VVFAKSPARRKTAGKTTCALKESDMANSLLETCNNWQIQRAEILSRNPDMAMTIDNLDTLIERTVRSAIDIAHRVDWDFREAERLAKEQAKAAGKGE
jgi:hypothetical protein